MISSDSDFTLGHYRKLLKLARRNYFFADYKNFTFGDRSIVWRHDCDFSLNRALVLARIEREEGVRSTFFVNPHSRFYNLLENEQWRFVNDILACGHDVGLHFDATFFSVRCEEQLHDWVSKEAHLIQQYFGVQPIVFSFHNPTRFHLDCEDEAYGGLINCYSKRFRQNVPYCSDSNGYWRFRRLYDVLEQATDPCLQVLTHPGWWQDAPMPPRRRVFRCAFGRAASSMRAYDKGLVNAERNNLEGNSRSIRFFESIDPDAFELFDYLWNTKRFQTLFLELSRLYESQISNLCMAALCGEWRVPAPEVIEFLDQAGRSLDGHRLFRGVFGDTWDAVTGQRAEAHDEWFRVRDRLLLARDTVAPELLEAGCVYLCGVVQSLAVWGKARPFGCDGLPRSGLVDSVGRKSADGGFIDQFEEDAEIVPGAAQKRWEALKAELLTGPD